MCSNQLSIPSWAGSCTSKPRKSAFEPEYCQIIEQFVARRNELGLTQTQLGERYGEDQSFISRVERLQRRIDIWEFVRFCAILNIDPQDIAGPLYMRQTPDEGRVERNVKLLFREKFDAGLHEVYRNV